MQGIYLIVHELECCEIRVDPWLRGVKDIPDNNTDECATKARANVFRKILDARVGLLPDTAHKNNPWKHINGAIILRQRLDIDVISKEEGRRSNKDMRTAGVGVTITRLEPGDC